MKHACIALVLDVTDAAPRTGRLALGMAAVAVLLAAGELAVEARPAVEIAAHGSSPYTIVVPDEADQARIMQAAALLQRTIGEASGAVLPIVKESGWTADTPAIYLGKSRAARRAGLPVNQVEGWAFHNQTVGRDVFLVGADGVYTIQDPDIPPARAIEHLGTLKAVTAFLEDQLGVRFLMPGEYGMHVPARERLEVAVDMERAWAPRFEFVIGRAPYERLNGIALNLFGNSADFKPLGGHSYYFAVPAEEYGETHPEYFALRGGVRTPAGNHLCISNPGVQERMLTFMEQQLDYGYQWILLGQTDGYEPCLCEDCVALAPEDIGERIWIVHRRLAAEMQQRRPDKKVVILAYANTAMPPKTFTDFPDNVIVQMCSYSPEMFDRWAPFNVAKTVYIYNWGQYKLPGYAPKRTPRYVIEQVRRFLNNGVRGIYIDGGFRGGQGAYSLDSLSYYAFGKALGDPAVDPLELETDFVNAAFGEAAAPMRAFFRTLNDRLDAYCLFDGPNVATGGTPSLFKAPEDYYGVCFPPNVLSDLTRNLKRAQALAHDEKVKARLQLLEMEFGHMRNLAGIYHMYRAYRTAPSQATLDELARKVAERDEIIAAIYPVTNTPVAIHGVPPPFLGAVKEWVENGGRNSGEISQRPPMNWDFGFLKESGLLPGTGVLKRLAVPKVDPFTLTGDPDKAVWQAIPYQELAEIGLGRTLNPARFKAAYDDNAFYIAVECEYDDSNWIERLQAVGRDGNAWAQECIEILIDPLGDREKHCQLVFNPIADSMYDARVNYITDELHPLYGKRDVGWNGDWHYVARIDPVKRRWTAEVRIPFATLEVEPAVRGTLWTMNVGRAEWPKPRGQGQAVYSTWSPNLEARSFHDRASYGEVVFE